MDKILELIPLESETLENLVFAFIVLIVAFAVSNLLRFFLNRFVLAASGKLNVDPTKYNFLKNAVSFIVFMAAIIIIFYKIPGLRDYGVTIFAGAGVIGIIIGFASQSAFSNIISGIFLVIFKPFSVGDLVKIGEHAGTVQDITLRHTVINNFENRRIVIPNSRISEETIINSSLTETKTCTFLEMGISYDSDIDTAIRIMQEEALKHPNIIDNRTEEDIQEGVPQVVVRLLGFGDSSVNLRGYIWANSSREGFIMKCDLHKSVKEAWDKAGIEIPFPYRTIVYKSDEKK
ncbi:MAG: mechanosensitive ion channel family protein [Candidatus Cyclobacteriaceae bacterium M2_1C_046]